MTTATAEPMDQAAMDAEDAHLFRAKLRRLANDVRRLQTDEGRRKEEWRTLRKARSRADGELTAAIEADATDDGDYLRRLSTLSRTAETAKDEEMRSHQEWVKTVLKRRQAQDELRVAVRKRFELLPLVDRANEWNGADQNGHAQEPLPQPSPARGEGTIEPRWRSLSIGELELAAKVEKHLRAAGIVLLGELADHIDASGSGIQGLRPTDYLHLRKQIDLARTDDPPAATNGHAQETTRLTASGRIVDDGDAQPRRIVFPDLAGAPGDAWRETPLDQTDVPAILLGKLSVQGLATAGQLADRLYSDRPGVKGIAEKHMERLRQAVAKVREGRPAETSARGCFNWCVLPAHHEGDCSDAKPESSQRMPTLEETLEAESNNDPGAPKPYGWDLTYRVHGEAEPGKCHYVGTEKQARKKTMLRSRAAEILTCEPLTEEQWVCTYGRGGM